MNKIDIESAANIKKIYDYKLNRIKNNKKVLTTEEANEIIAQIAYSIQNLKTSKYPPENRLSPLVLGFTTYTITKIKTTPKYKHLTKHKNKHISFPELIHLIDLTRSHTYTTSADSNSLYHEYQKNQDYISPKSIIYEIGKSYQTTIENQIKWTLTVLVKYIDPGSSKRNNQTYISLYTNISKKHYEIVQLEPGITQNQIHSAVTTICLLNPICNNCPLYNKECLRDQIDNPTLNKFATPDQQIERR